MFRVCQAIDPDPEGAQRIMAFGMLMTMAAAMDLPAVDEQWAQLCSRHLND